MDNANVKSIHDHLDSIIQTANYLRNIVALPTGDADDERDMLVELENEIRDIENELDSTADMLNDFNAGVR